MTKLNLPPAPAISRRKFIQTAASAALAAIPCAGQGAARQPGGEESAPLVPRKDDPQIRVILHEHDGWRGCRLLVTSYCLRFGGREVGFHTSIQFSEFDVQLGLARIAKQKGLSPSYYIGS